MPLIKVLNNFSMALTGVNPDLENPFEGDSKNQPKGLISSVVYGMKAISLHILG